MAKLFVVFASPQHIPYAPGTTAKEWGVEAIRRMDGYVQGLLEFTHNQVGGLPVCSVQTVYYRSIHCSWLALTFLLPSLFVHLWIINVHNQTNGSALAMGSDAGRRIDFQFQALVKDVPAAIAEIYSRFGGAAPTKEALDSFNAYLEQYARHKTGKQSRKLGDFGLTEADLAHWAEHDALFLS
jgi:hypothetical protein